MIFTFFIRFVQRILGTLFDKLIAVGSYTDVNGSGRVVSSVSEEESVDLSSLFEYLWKHYGSILVKIAETGFSWCSFFNSLLVIEFLFVAEFFFND